MKTLLSLDLGLSTGWAAYKGDEAMAYGVISNYKHFEEELKKLLLTHMPTHSVCERPVIFRGHLGNTLEDQLVIVRRVLDHQVKFIEAREWKNTKYKKHPVPRGISQHERDALRIGIWYYDTYLISL